MSTAPSSFDWTARVTHHRDASTRTGDALPTLVGELQRSGAGSAPILFAADDGERYWVKFPGNPQGTQTIIAETIVAEIAPLIGAPARASRRVNVPAAFDGLTYGPDLLHRIPAGLAHGSVLIPHATEREGELGRANRDDNARRIPRLIVLWDWAMGEDEQWLHDDDAQSTIWSFDHGLWLDTAEGPWTQQSITAVTGTPWNPPGRIPKGLDAAEFFAAASALDAITEEQLALAVSRVPRDWEPDDGLLGMLGAMLYARRDGAAARARALGSSTTKGGRP